MHAHLPIYIRFKMATSLSVLTVILSLAFQVTLTDACYDYYSGYYYCVYGLWYFWFGIGWLIVFMVIGCSVYWAKRKNRQRMITTQSPQNYTSGNIMVTQTSGTHYTNHGPPMNPVQPPPYGQPAQAPPPYSQNFNYYPPPQPGVSNNDPAYPPGAAPPPPPPPGGIYDSSYPPMDQQATYGKC